jgi:hypothetical protein
MICGFCGLETGRPTSHETQEVCIEALRQDVLKLRDVLQHARRAGEPPPGTLPHGVVAQDSGGGAR